MRRRGRPGLIGTAARTAVIAGTATAVSGNVSRRQAGRAEQQQEQEAAAQQQAAAEQAAAEPPAEVAAPAPAADRITLLQQLADLKNQGLLTDEEFATEKARILAE